jgi:endothelin-converting enzyme/putative endopeptidase
VRALLSDRPADGESVARLAPAVARLHLGVADALFVFRSEQDRDDATRVIGYADQGGLGLPDREYYLSGEGKFPELRRLYQEHVARTFVLAGWSEADAAKGTEAVLRIERALAEGSMPLVERRDPRKTWHRIDLEGLKGIASRFEWDVYLRTIGHPEVRAINVASPGFFTALDRLLAGVPPADWRAYLAWHALRGASPSLSRPFVDEDFRFYGQTLNGVRELAPRWKRCIGAVDHALGEALGRPFVAQTFGEGGKERTLSMIHAIEAEMRQHVGGLAWMDDDTRREARTKLDAIANKIGYPDRWRDYGALDVTRGAHLANVVAAGAFERHRQLAKIGRPVDRAEWQMTPPTVNAYYEPALNEMVFPAGILQPPFYRRDARPAVNFGAIGMVMGHELTHGFDDEGRKFDARGNLRDWWSATTGREFERRTGCLVRQYGTYVAVDDLRVNGRLTLGENIADLGGIQLAYRAFVRTHGTGGGAAGFTDAQLFFLGTAQAWCSKTRPENARVRVATDPHSPPEFRVNGPLANLPEFAGAFGCRAGARMAPVERCAVW